MYRILHVGLGPLGRIVVADLHERGLGEIVAAVDPARDVAGKPLRDLVPSTQSSIVVQEGLDAVRDWSPIDAAIVTTSSSLAACAPTFRELLARGVAVVSTCEELVWPWLRHEQLAEELDLLAREKHGRLLGTGVNPGFLMDAFPLFATGICKSVERLEVVRRQDASVRRVPFQKKIGAGLDERGFRDEVAAGRIRHVGLPESMHFLAHALGFSIDEWHESIDPVIAERDLECALGKIARGRVCGIRQEIRGEDGGALRLDLKFMAAIGLADPGDRVVVHGEPPVDLTWKGGVQGDVATSAIVANAVGPLRSAPPGLHTMNTIPIVGWVAGHRGSAPIRRRAASAQRRS